ncbi:GDSL-type esterase/lipase family protein [Paenisporosarcina sp. TG20]|uniref:GDSL-type esterase/lipase family protein n=1 Tax=Paenisporosarcina sp. TG20 TaxID=1211706 RepID=UPI0003163C46|nr:GDSL-type esterase/lipase family protein [Paenisporosarcina sp. TG20]
MIKQLILVILVSTFILTGCQYNPGDSGDFTTRQPIYTEDFIVKETFITEDKFLVGLGDSLTQGVGDERKMGGYLSRLSTKMSTFQGVRKIELINEGKRGLRSDQLLKKIKFGDLETSLQKADLIVVSIGGNDIMKIVKKDLFRLRVESFEKELINFKKRYREILTEIRMVNQDSPIILLGLYNPFSVVIAEDNEFDQIMINWNAEILNVANDDVNACYVPVDDLFETNVNMVYHTDFFHPNSKGYEQMTNRILESLNTCDLFRLTNGEMDL